MKRGFSISVAFVDSAPTKLEERVVYVSERFSTVIHSCMCGCGREVITPLSRAGWQLTRDGDAISLYPSIGNWSFPCQSHYWIRNNRVVWAGQWSRKRIDRGRERDRRAYDDLYGGSNDVNERQTLGPVERTSAERWWRRFLDWAFGK